MKTDPLKLVINSLKLETKKKNNDKFKINKFVKWSFFFFFPKVDKILDLKKKKHSIQRNVDETYLKNPSKTRRPMPKLFKCMNALLITVDQSSPMKFSPNASTFL